MVCGRNLFMPNLHLYCGKQFMLTPGVKGKGSPILNEHRLPELIPVLGS